MPASGPGGAVNWPEPKSTGGSVIEASGNGSGCPIFFFFFFVVVVGIRKKQLFYAVIHS